MGLPRLSAYVLAVVAVLEVVAVGILVVIADQPVSRVAVASALSLYSVALGVVVAHRRPTNWVGPGSILSKLGLATSDEDHRRVLAVLVYLSSA